MLRKSKNFREKYKELKNIPDSFYPNHLFIIPDGNRRFAKKHGRSSYWGHSQGFKLMVRIMRNLKDLPIATVGFWGFSADNWKRNKVEIAGLMKIFSNLIDGYIDELNTDNRRFVHLGRKDRLPEKLLKKIDYAEELTKDNTGQIVALALDFGGTDQELRVLKKAKKLNKIDEESLWKLRDSNGLVRSAQLIFRTSETRTSDVGWLNGKHSVLYFLPNKFFPEVDESDLIKSIVYYSKTRHNEGK